MTQPSPTNLPPLVVAKSGTFFLVDTPADATPLTAEQVALVIHRSNTQPGLLEENERLRSQVKALVNVFLRAKYIRYELAGDPAARAWDRWERETTGGGKHYPEEWGPKDKRALTCVCGNEDPMHYAAVIAVEEYKAAAGKGVA